MNIIQKLEIFILSVYPMTTVRFFSEIARRSDKFLNEHGYYPPGELIERWCLEYKSE